MSEGIKKNPSQTLVHDGLFSSYSVFGYFSVKTGSLCGADLLLCRDDTSRFEHLLLCRGDTSRFKLSLLKALSDGKMIKQRRKNVIKALQERPRQQTYG